MILPALVISDQRMRPAAGTILVLKKSDIILAVVPLLKVFIDTELSSGYATAACKNRVDLILRNEALLLDIHRIRCRKLYLFRIKISNLIKQILR